LRKIIFKHLFLIVLILEFNLPGYSKSDIEEIVKYLPSSPTICLYIKSLKKVWNDFRYSYFWKKYKLSTQGKEIQRALDSISAASLIVGLTFDDLLEIFSNNGALALWVNNNVLVNFMYLIETNNKIKDFLQRLEFYVIAEKKNYNKYNYKNVEIINFDNKVYIAIVKKLTVITDNKVKIEQTIDNIIKDTNSINFSIPSYFGKNKNIILWNNINKSILYSFEFKRRLVIEALTDIDSFITNAKLNLKEIKFIPSNVNFISFSENSDNIKNLYAALFKNIDTNVINIDLNYFENFFKNIEWVPSNTTGCVGINLKSKSTNVICVFSTTNTTMISNFIKKSTNSISYYRKKIYCLPSKELWKYFSIYDDYLLLSNSLKFLKSSIEGYKRRKSFYYTSEMKRIFLYSPLRRKNINAFVWMNLKRYIISKSFKYPKEKWLLYNAYIKTFARLLIYGYKRDSSFYTILKTYSFKK